MGSSPADLARSGSSRGRLRSQLVRIAGSDNERREPKAGEEEKRERREEERGGEEREGGKGKEEKRGEEGREGGKRRRRRRDRNRNRNRNQTKPNPQPNPNPNPNPKLRPPRPPPPPTPPLSDQQRTPSLNPTTIDAITEDARSVKEQKLSTNIPPVPSFSFFFVFSAGRKSARLRVAFSSSVNQFPCPSFYFLLRADSSFYSDDTLED